MLVDGNLDNCDADYQGKYAFSTCYNPNKGVTVAEMTDHEQAWAVIFDIAAIEDAVKRGDFKEMGGVKASNGRNWVEIHALSTGAEFAGPGCNTAPDGIHVVIV